MDTPTPPSSAPPADALDALERRVLDFETFGFSTTRYHQLLHRAVDRPAGLAYDPMLVRRLRRLRALRRKRRTAQRLGITL